jgi:ATP-dependent DNA helicase RecG
LKDTVIGELLVGQKFNYYPIIRADILQDEYKSIILIEVKEAPRYQKPIYIRDAGPIKGGFKRLGATDIRLTDSDIGRYYQERSGSIDAQLIPDTKLEDVDKKTIESFRNLRKLIKPDAPRNEETAHRNALREALTNLLMHQNYFHYSPAQVRVYNDRVEFYIAAVFYDIGWAEAKGTGIKTTREQLKVEGYPLPEYANNTKGDTFTLILRQPIEQVTPQVTPQVEMLDRFALNLNFCETPMDLKEIMSFLKLRDRKHFIEKVLNPLLEKGYLKRTIPDKPSSRFQKYVVGDPQERRTNSAKHTKKVLDRSTPVSLGQKVRRNEHAA